MKKIKNGDVVIVLTGKDKGRTGKVIRMIKDGRAVVEGVNVVKKHVKPNPYKNTQGGIIEREASIHISNLALINPMTNKADKVGFKYIVPKTEGGKPQKVRYFKSNDEMVDAVE